MLDRFSAVVGGLDHPEGVTWGGDGRLYAGGEEGQLYRADLEGGLEEIGRTGGFVLGVCVDARSRVYACDMGLRAVFRFDPATGALETYCDAVAGTPLELPNYAAFDDAGNLYVTDSGPWQAHTGRILRIAPGGHAEVWSSALPHFPNGCALDAAGTALYVLESLHPALWRVPIAGDGSAGKPELVVELPGTLPDGIALAEDGSAYVSCYRPDRIYRIAPGAEVTVVAEDPHGLLLSAPTNLVFGGPGLGRLIVANLNQHHLAAADIGVRGLPLRYPDLP